MTIQKSRKDFLETVDISDKVTYLEKMVEESANNTSENTEVRKLISNAIVFRKINNSEKLFECLNNINNNYPGEISGWILNLLAYTDNLKLLNVHGDPDIVTYYNAMKILDTITILAEAENKNTFNEIKELYQKNCYAYTNQLYYNWSKNIGNADYINKFALSEETKILLKIKDDQNPLSVYKIEGLYSLIRQVVIFINGYSEIQKKAESAKKSILDNYRATTENSVDSVLAKNNPKCESWRRDWLINDLYNKGMHTIQGSLDEIDNTLKSMGKFFIPNQYISHYMNFSGTDDEFILRLIDIIHDNAQARDKCSQLIDLLSDDQKSNLQKKKQKKNESNEVQIDKIKDNSSNTEESQTENNKPQKLDVKQRFFAALAYIGPLVLIPLFAYRDSKFVRYHINQGVSVFVLDLINDILFKPLLTRFLWQMSWIGRVISIILGVIMIVGVCSSLLGKEIKIPVIGEWKFAKSLMDKFLK